MFDNKTVIIGGGLGGLVSGALLSKEGHKVVVVEKNPVIGGGLQSYKRFGSIFDTGMHVFGGMQPGGNIRRITDYLGISDKFVTVDLDKESDTEIYIHNERELYQFSFHSDCLIKTLSAYFPGSEKELLQYQMAVRKLMDGFHLFNLKTYDNEVIKSNDEMYLSADVLVDKYISDPKLKTLLSVLNVFYGGEKGISSSMLHAAISVIFMNGACRVAGGYSTFANALADCILENGGEILTSEKVEKIVADERRVNKIITNSGKQISGENYIFSLPYSSLMSMYEGDLRMSKSYRNWIDSRIPSLSAFIINIKLKEKTLKYFNRIGFYLDSYADAWKPSDGNNVNRFMYMTPPVINQGEYADTLNIIIPMKWSAVSNWSDTTVGNRGEEYKRFKQKITNLAIEKMSNVFPGIKEKIAGIDTSSPLTIRDYTGSLDGAMCGYRKKCDDPIQFMPVVTRVPNLYLTGQCVNLHGFCGVTLTAIETCEAIVGRNNIIKKINPQ